MNQGRASFLPPEWDDDARMRVLMSSMPNIHDRVARSGRHSFWSDILNRWCRAKLSPTFTERECMTALRRGTMSPHCLPDVLQEMYSQGEIVPYQEFVRGNISRQGESWGNWGIRVLVGIPVRYTWGFVKEVMGLDSLGQGVLVNTVVLRELCDELLNTVHRHFTTTIPSSSTSLLSIAQLYALTGLGLAGGSADTLRLLVDTLVANGSASIAEHRGTTCVKFVMPGDLAPPEITDVELAEIDLSRAQSEVEEAVRKMTEETERLKQQARTALKLGSKVEALAILRRKKRLEKSLTMQLGVLENVSTCLQQLQHSYLNRQVLGAFQKGVEALKTAISGAASPEGAADTLDELRQVLEECEDVSAVVSGGVAEGQDGEEADLQAELDQLLDTQPYHSKEEEMEQDDLKLPDVPTSRPVVYGLVDSDRSPEVL